MECIVKIYNSVLMSIQVFKNWNFFVSKFFLKQKYISNKSKYGEFLDAERWNYFTNTQWKAHPRAINQFFMSIWVLKNYNFFISKCFLKLKYFSIETKYGMFIDAESCDDSFFIKCMLKISSSGYHLVFMSMRIKIVIKLMNWNSIFIKNFLMTHFL